jgi:SOS-response transcriptional repressor LexA
VTLSGVCQRGDCRLCSGRTCEHECHQRPSSPTRTRILEFIVSYVKERQYPPTVREIGEAVGLSSPSTVHAHLNTLEREGFIGRDPTKPRALWVKEVA